MKPRKPKAGVVSKQMEKISTIRRQMTRERERHNNKMASIVAQRDALRGVGDPALRAAKLTKLRYDETEEYQRHKAKMDELQRRTREA